MSYLALLNQRMQGDEMIRHGLGLNGSTEDRAKMDAYSESFRQIEWEKAGIMNSALAGKYRKDQTDEEILKGIKLDADDGLIFARQLEEIDARRFEVIRKPLDVWKRLLPVRSFAPGTDRITYRVHDYFGKAKLTSSGNVTESEIAGARAKEASNKIFSWTLAYEYTARELRQAQFAGVPLSTEDVRAVGFGYAEKIQEVMLTGDTQTGLEGIANHTGVTNTQVSTAIATGDSTWTPSTKKTPDEIVDDITGMTTEIFQATRGKYGMANMVVALPLEQLKYIGNKRMASGTDTTIAEYIMRNNAVNGIARFEPVFEFQGLGTGSTDLAMAYPFDPVVLEANIADQILWMPPQVRGKAFIFDSEMEYGGVTVRYPVAVTQRYGV